jgi:hypothetical protein
MDKFCKLLAAIFKEAAALVEMRGTVAALDFVSEQLEEMSKGIGEDGTH